MKLFAKFKSSVLTAYLFSFLFLLPLEGFSEEPHGFSLIKFGDKKEKAIQKLVEKYAYAQVDNAIVGNNQSTLNNSQKTVWISNFPLSKTHKVTVWFYFNANEKFYKYEIESAGIPSKNGDNTVKSIADFMGQIYQKKFGPPVKKYDLSYLNLKEGYISIYQKWEFTKKQAMVAFKLLSLKSYVIASAQDDELEKEPLITSNSDKLDAEVEDAANSF